MDTSFELLSSMSPKVTKRQKSPFKKPPSKLALKKYFRRSSLPVVNNSKKDESIITIESSSTETCSSSSSDARNINETPIVISESELSFSGQQNNCVVNKENCRTSCRGKNGESNGVTSLSQEKYTTIKHWVDEVNNVKQDATMFSEISTLYGDDEYFIKNTSKKKTAVNSTFMEPSSKRFDQLFKKKHDKEAQNKDVNDSFESVAKQSVLAIDDSLITEDNSDKKDSKLSEIEDSLCQLNLDDSVEKKQMQNNTELRDYDECENLLDSLYGNSWREKKDDILPSSEPRPKKIGRTPRKEIPKTERPVKVLNFHSNIDNRYNSNNLLGTLQRARFKKALESPLINSIKKLCDPDTDSEDETRRELTPVKLNFEDEQESKKYLISSDESSDSSKNKVQTRPRKNIIKNNSRSKKNKELTSDTGKSETGCYSFLASLSASVPMSQCDMSAWIYKNNFKEHKEQLAAKLFQLYNEKIFDNAIPADTPLEWNDRMRGTAGFCYCRKITRRTGAVERAVRIVLSTKVLDSADRLRDTLVHEMCHAGTWIVNQISDGHGPFWKSWADRAMRTFPKLPPIKRCHQYVIHTKYTYKCTDCGYSIGRHTKSLDVERKRCGYCFGKFEVFINKTNKNGETKSVPATPKKPLTGFARFVKENYATHKTPDLTHADVMKILGQKFSNLKFD